MWARYWKFKFTKYFGLQRINLDWDKRGMNWSGSGRGQVVVCR